VPTKGIVLQSVLTGGLGVASGFAVFFLTLEDDHPFQLIAILFVVTVLSFIVERLRELIDTTPDELRDHRGPPTRIFSSLLIIGLSEVFALGWHAALMTDTPELAAVAQVVTGGVLSSDHATAAELAGLVLVWMISGTALSAALAFGIGPSTRAIAERMATGFGRGVLVGAMVAPGVLFVTIVFGFALAGLSQLVFEPDVWVSNLRVLEQAVGHYLTNAPGIVVLIFLAVDKLLLLFGEHSRLASLAVIAAMVGAAIVIVKRRGNGPAGLVLLAALCLVMAPLLLGLGRMLALLARTAVVWALPGAVLGALVPLLERPAALHRWWSVVAFAAAAVLILLTAARLDARLWLVVPTVGIIAAGAFVWRTGRVEVCWPVLAMSVATIVCGLMIAMQQVASFTGVLGALYDVESLPSRISSMVPEDKASAKVFADFDLAVQHISAIATQRSAPHQVVSPEAAREQQRVALEAVMANRAEWQTKFDELQERTAKCFPPDVKNFGQRLSDIVCAEGLLTPLEAGVRENLKTSQALGKEITSDDMLKQWTAHEQALEDLLGEPADGHTAAGITAFKAAFNEQAAKAYATVSGNLELSLAGSIGFWTTLGLLAGWSLYRRDAGV
jgi:hypothetical protein